MAIEGTKPTTTSTTKFAQQSEKLSLQAEDVNNERSKATAAVKARFITPVDPIIETADGSRLPTVPLKEALELNKSRDEAGVSTRGERNNNAETGRSHPPDHESQQSEKPDAALRTAIPSSRTNPLFPELPLYGPPSLLRDLQCFGLRCSSAVLSLAFLGVIVLGSAFTSIPLMLKHIGITLRLKDPNARRPFYQEEKRRTKARKADAEAWKRRQGKTTAKARKDDEEQATQVGGSEFEPTEGGKDPLICDAGYYARRVGLDIEEFSVMTEDGFIIELLHVYNPKERPALPASHRDHGTAVVFPKSSQSSLPSSGASDESKHLKKRKYPVLLIPGLLQSTGAYCANDDDSLAFFLAKSGYDVWLGNNRCGFKPRHQLLSYKDPRMWNWNIRQMGVLDLAAHVSRVLSETGFQKLGLICHSQGTTQTFVALAKEQRPDLGNKISVFCALAPAVYAGPLIGKMYFKFMRIISSGMFRIFFGIHAFIPFMMTMHACLPGRLYGALGYRVFSFLFNWTDDRWDQGLRNRMFQFAPVYVSAESMRWWLGRECFATQKCILATREEGKQEDEEDKEDEEEDNYQVKSPEHSTENMLRAPPAEQQPQRKQRAWYDDQVPPFALWVAGSDELVDGKRLLRRFEKGREPYVRVVHSSIIDEYEHLDVLWAMDAIEKVGKEVRTVLWKTVAADVREGCVVPWACEGVGVWEG
jgi:pimeloyl-ACP methyl ester carboxylesterase